MDTAIIAAMIQAVGIIVAALILVTLGKPRSTPVRTPQTEQAGQSDSVASAFREFPQVPRSLNGDVQTPIQFHNGTARIIKVFWIDYQGKPILAATLQPGHTCNHNTCLTHPWLITDESDAPIRLHYPELRATTVTIGD